MASMDVLMKDNGKILEKPVQTAVTSKASNTKPRVRATKKNVSTSEFVAIKKAPKGNSKGKGKKRPALLNKSVYRYHYQQTKPKLRRLMEANEVLKDELDRKNNDMTVLCGDIHNLLERLEPYVISGSISSNPEAESLINASRILDHPKLPLKTKPMAKSPKRKCVPEKSAVEKPSPEKPAKRPKKPIMDKTLNSSKMNSDFEEEKLRIVEEVELLLNGNAVEKEKIPKKDPISFLNDLHLATLHNQQILDDFMMLEFNLKPREFDTLADNDADVQMPLILPKETFDEITSVGIERRSDIDMNCVSETEAESIAVSQPSAAFLKQMKSHLSFFIPSDMDHELLNPDIPQTLPDDIFSET